MSKETRRFMRIIVFFDLPMVTKAEKKVYVQFRRFLLNDGYDMIQWSVYGLIQWSVYGRLLCGVDDEQKHLKRLIDNLPPAGSVRCMTVTEKQFAGIKLLVGPPRFSEKRGCAAQLLLF
jgi:CRISPR-associated protein Cas2